MFSSGVIVYWQVAALDGPLTLLAGSPGPAYGHLFVLLVDACYLGEFYCCYSFAIFPSCVSFTHCEQCTTLTNIYLWRASLVICLDCLWWTDTFNNIMSPDLWVAMYAILNVPLLISLPNWEPNLKCHVSRHWLYSLNCSHGILSFLDSIPKCPVDIVLPTVTLHIIACHIWFLSLWVLYS